VREISGAPTQESTRTAGIDSSAIEMLTTSENGRATRKRETGRVIEAM
jgi:hypothetical protein